MCVLFKVVLRAAGVQWPKVQFSNEFYLQQHRSFSDADISEVSNESGRIARPLSLSLSLSLSFFFVLRLNPIHIPMIDRLSS